MQVFDEQFLKAMGLWPLWIPKETPAPATDIDQSIPLSSNVTAVVHTSSEERTNTAPPDTERSYTPPAFTSNTKAAPSATAKAGLAAALAAARGGSKPSNTPAPNTPKAPVTPISETPTLQPAEDLQNLTVSNKPETDNWDKLYQDIRACRACSLCESRTQTVPGVGDETADWLFIGEAPGAEEDKQGEPFVGTAGKLLDNMLLATGLRRGEQVYIANVLKCRPPNNRDPLPEEVNACRPFLKRQIDLIAPKQIVALGKFAANTLLAQETTLSSLRGKVHESHGIPVIVTYHPAYLLRNLPDKAKAWEDLCLAKNTINQPR